MISSLLKDSSDGLDAVSVQMISKITYKTRNLITMEIFPVLFMRNKLVTLFGSNDAVFFIDFFCKEKEKNKR